MNSSLYYRHSDPNPCFKCKNRILGCHSKCEQYSAWKDGIEQDKKTRDKILDGEIKKKSCYAKGKEEKYGQTKKN